MPPPKPNPFRPTLIKPAAKLCHGLRTLNQFKFCYFLPLSITHPNLVKFVSPIHADKIAVQRVLLFKNLLLPLSRALNGMFALYRSSPGQLSIEPLAPFSYRPGRSSLDPRSIESAWSSCQQALKLHAPPMLYRYKTDVPNIRICFSPLLVSNRHCVTKPKKSKSRFFVAPLLIRMTLRNSLKGGE